MIDVRYRFPGDDMIAMAFWLDEIMPNPIVGEGEPRWMLGESAAGQFGIRFYNDEDATMFALRWIKE